MIDIKPDLRTADAFEGYGIYCNSNEVKKLGTGHANCNRELKPIVSPTNRRTGYG